MLSEEPYQSIQLLILSPFFAVHFLPALGMANAFTCVGQQNEIDHLAYHQKQWVQIPALLICTIYIGFKTFVTVYYNSESDIDLWFDSLYFDFVLFK